MKHFLFTPFILLSILFSCKIENKPHDPRVRKVVDTVGFAHLDWQMDSVISRINTTFYNELEKAAQPDERSWKLAICPHDDYTYASWLYPAVLKNIKAKTVIIFGVAHKAANFKLENKLVFDSFDYWVAPYGLVKTSPLRAKLIRRLSEGSFIVNDSMQIVEHSVEALIPFLQYQNNNVEIVSILVPYTDLQTMERLSTDLSEALAEEIKAQKLVWGEDITLLITSDAVHYGNEDWNGKDYAPYGADSIGNKKAQAHEEEIIENCFIRELNQGKAEKFYNYTVNTDNYKEYLWTWCGRYSIPMGIKTAAKLCNLLNEKPLTGVKIAYSSSILQEHIPVNDLRMGTTAIATERHWVGYPAVGFW